MVALETPLAEFGFKAPDFSLKGTDGRLYSLADVQGEKGTVVMFICNHCPFVQAILDDIIQDMRDLRTQGVSAVAIMPNDVSKYPKDGPDEMRSLAESKHFPFPYLFDATQEVAKA